MKFDKELFYKISCAVTFMPFIGWIITILTVKKDNFKNECVKLSYRLALLAVSIIFGLNLFNFLIGHNFFYAEFTTAIIINAVIILYLLLSIVEIIFSLQKKIFKIPFITKISNF